jgi:minor extracellular serine protease Vpr
MGNVGTTAGWNARGGGVVRRLLATAMLAAALVTGTLVAPPGASAAEPALYLVTLAGPGTAGDRGFLPDALRRVTMHREQDRALGRVGSPEPVYRWTTALNGVAVRLSAAQADELAADPRVALVEKNSVRRLAGSAGPPGVPSGPGATRGGAGTVIGVVDSGIAPESPLFAPVPGLGRAPSGFHGDCVGGADWDTGGCDAKLVGARWFVDGFGADNVRAASSLSPRDDDGHGTQMASIAAGNAGVSVRVDDQRLGSYGGIAPQARLAVYKACWMAPDPSGDGCATADLVTAIDAAVRDGVDVLNLSVGGPAGFDTVERALLGAAESDVVVVAAAGNAGERAFAAHAGPWVTTVGGTTSVARRGEVSLGAHAPLTGAMASTRGTGPARVVRGELVAAPGTSRAQARVCAPGSLDAARVAGAIVVCARGSIGRVDKSAAVREADGVGMVLVNTGPGSVAADFHSVPTVHLNKAAGVALRRWLADHPRGRATLRPIGVERTPARVTRWSASGDPAAGVLKPDVVAPGAGVLGAVPPEVGATRWDFVSGTSAATAYTSGTAALLLARHDWPASIVRSALATTAAPVGKAGSVLRQGAGRVHPGRAGSPGVAYVVPVGDYRDWLTGTLPHDRLNTPSLLLGDQHVSETRTITNVGRRAMYFSSSARGFTRHTVSVTPAAVRLGPGESARFAIRVSRPPGVQPLDDGWVTWRGANGTRARIPVLVSR